MAFRNREYTRINPIDEQSNVAIGVTLPFNNEGVFYSSYTTKEQVKSNLINVLLTDPGERLFKPNFGVGVRSLLFEQGINLEEIKSRITSQINLYIPEINLTRILANQNNHTLTIKLFYQVIANSETDSVQLNINTNNDII